MELPKRKNIRLEHFDYSSPGAYFLTVCTKERKNYFWDPAHTVGATIGRPQDVALSPYGEIVKEAICKISKIYPIVAVDHYVIMPDHIHILLIVRADEHGRPMVAPTTDRLMRQMKGYITKKIGRSIWQKRFIDHVIRNRQDYEEHVKYIYENPLKWHFNKLYADK